MPSNAAKALPDLEFRFTWPDDQGKYGKGWHTYSEMALMLLPVRRLIALEHVVDMSLVNVMNGSREASTEGELAATWLALHLEDPALAGEYASYEPHIAHLEWRKKRELRAVPKEDSISVTSDPALSETSPITPPVVLPT